MSADAWTPNLHCTDCGKRFDTGHVLKNANPPLPGRWHHTDCNNPTLAQQEEQ